MKKQIDGVRSKLHPTRLTLVYYSQLSNRSLVLGTSLLGRLRNLYIHLDSLLDRYKCKLWQTEDSSSEPHAGELAPYPLQPIVELVKKQAIESPVPPICKNEYLSLANGILTSFLPHQQQDGSILDPYEHKEIQYATPAFSCAAAIAGHNLDPRLLHHASAAMTSAVNALTRSRVPDSHTDFCTQFVMHALEHLQMNVDRSQVETWRQKLSSLVPELLYKNQPDRQLTNWNTVAINGEWLRHRAGLQPSVRWIERRLALQCNNFTVDGLYRDPGGGAYTTVFPLLWNDGKTEVCFSIDGNNLIGRTSRQAPALEITCSSLIELYNHGHPFYSRSGSLRVFCAQSDKGRLHYTIKFAEPGTTA